jgi:hypothetical protein
MAADDTESGSEENQNSAVLVLLRQAIRRTMVTALAFGAVAVAIALWRAPALASVGIVLGIGMAVMNYRLMDAGVARVESTGNRKLGMLRRAIAARTFARLGAITVVAVILLIVNGPLGVGTVVGLVLFQIAFVINAGRVVMSEGIG